MIRQRIPYTRITLPGLVAMTERTLAILRQNHQNESFFTRNMDKLEEAKALATKAVGSSSSSQGTKTVT